jgi:hypothetical protein
MMFAVSQRIGVRGSKQWALIASNATITAIANSVFLSKYGVQIKQSSQLVTAFPANVLFTAIRGNAAVVGGPHRNAKH